MDIVWEVFSWMTATVTLASVVSAMTPTDKDDRIVAKMKQFVEILAVNIGHAKKQ
jgi:hypothetical protein